MDIQISYTEIRRQRIRKWLVALALIFLVAALLFSFKSFFKTSLNLHEIKTVVVEEGSIENTLNASAEIVPAFELSITSPIQAEIKQTLLKPGSQVSVKQPIIVLDKEFVMLEYDQLKNQVDLKRNNILQQEIQLQKNIVDLETNNQIKALKISDLKAQLETSQRLNKIGGNTKEEIKQAELNLSVAELEKKQLEIDLLSKRKLINLDLKSYQLELQIQQKKLQELAKKVEQANIVAGRAGIVTWVNENIGSKVNVGDILAKIADLKSFRLKGSVADIYAQKVKTGQRVIAKINETKLLGTIQSIEPTIQNGIVSFLVELDESNSTVLRQNLKTELFIITDSKEKVLRVNNTALFNGKQSCSIFVVEGNVATKRTVRIGSSNFDYVELLGDIKAGDKIIITEMDEYKNSDKIEINTH
jgi:HlyD family secretion protein